MTAIKLLSKNKYLKFPLLFTGGGGGSLLPPELQACEYLQTDGSAFIILNVKCNDITDLTCICLQNNASTSVNDTYIFGKGSTSGYNKQFSLGSEDGNYRFYAFSNKSNRTTSTQSIENELTFIFNKSQKKAIFNNEEKAISYEIVYVGENDKLYIFGANINGVMHVNQNNLQIKELYQDGLFYVVSCYIKDGQTYIDNKGVECIAGKPGLYDITNEIFYTNDGIGEFTHGADIKI